MITFNPNTTFAIVKNWKDHIRNYAAIQRAAVFVVTLAVIYIFVPEQGLFKYEYQLNQPWKHDKLLAPFEFGILKSEAEIQKEKESISASQPLVFSYKSENTDEVLAKFGQSVHARLPDTIHICDSAMIAISEIMANQLSKGLLARNELGDVNLKPFDKVLIEFNGELRTSENDLLPKINTIISAVDSGLAVEADSLCKSILYQAAVESVKPNTHYNDSLTKRLTDLAINDIITIVGKVDRGTAIIDRGEIVNAEKFAALESLRKEYGNRVISETGIQWSIVGEMGLIIILIGLLILFVYLNENRLFNDPRPLTLTLSLVGVAFIVSSLSFKSDVLSIYVIPLGITPLLLRMFYDIKVSLFTHFISTLIIALFITNPLEFIVIQMSALSFATLYQAASTRRSRMLTTALIVFISYSVIYSLVSLAQNGNWSAIDTGIFGWIAINALLCMLVFPLIYLVEKVFGYTSETTLLELSESSQPLLKELAIKAPGTFQHSLQVANLCEKVAGTIGGNATLLRTAAMYHDVGKMSDPQFFIENQLPDNNPHDDLEPTESAQIIVNHVKKGIDLCLNANLPMDIIQFIQTHHGTSTVRFFLKKAQENAKSQGLTLDESLFSYPGPTPKTKEQAILMMADSVEAASRTLKKYDKDSINQLVDGLVDYQRNEGQFEDAPITFQDISAAKRALKLALHGIFHQRISYD